MQMNHASRDAGLAPGGSWVLSARATVQEPAPEPPAGEQTSARSELS
jgi:hypothetical protein